MHNRLKQLAAILMATLLVLHYNMYIADYVQRAAEDGPAVELMEEEIQEAEVKKAGEDVETSRSLDVETSDSESAESGDSSEDASEALAETAAAEAAEEPSGKTPSEEVAGVAKDEKKEEEVPDAVPVEIRTEEDAEADEGESDEFIEPENEPGETEESDEAEFDEGALIEETTELSGEGKNFEVAVTLEPETMVPKDTELTVTEIDRKSKTHDYDGYYEEALRALQEEDEAAELRFVRFYDLTLTAGDEIVEPAAPVNVKFTFLKGLDLKDAENIHILHFDEQEGKASGEEPAAEILDPENVSTTLDTIGKSSEEKLTETEFEAEHFSVFAIVGTVIEKNVLASDGNNYKVTVTYGAEAGIPAGADLEVNEILPGDGSDAGAASAYDEYVAKTENALGMEEGSSGYIRLFDIKIVDKDDHNVKYQPADGATVDVKIELADAESDDLMVVHFSDESKDGDVVNSVVSVSALQDDGMTVSFEAAGFSAYAIVQGPSAIPLEWNRITTLDKLKELGEAGLYIGTTSGYYMTNTTAVGSQDAATTGIVKTKPAQNFPSDAAVKYYFEAVPETSDRFYVYCLGEDGSKLYVQNTGDQNLYLADASEKTAFTALVDNNGRFRFQNGDRYWNMWNGANANHIACWTSPTDGNNYFYVWDHDEAVSDPYKLDGKKYGLMYWVDGTNGKALMSSQNKTGGHLDALSLTVMSKANNSSKLYVPDDSDISFWTFHHVNNDNYYLTADVDGSTKYLKITSSGLTLESTPDDGCKIQVIPGEGAHAGQITLKAGGKTLSYSGKIDSGFQAGGTAGLEWLNLVEESELDSTYFKKYSAGKVSVSDESVTNGSRVIVYTRVWNETSKKYEFYAIDQDGSLVRCYQSGDNIEWVGGTLNSMLWNFVEYYWEGTTDPNGYYELYNQYSEKYIAPQKSSEQVLSDDTIGINMNGRQNGRYYSPIVAWDDGYYAYVGLKADMVTGKVISCPLGEADDFYFAIVQDLPIDDELHTVETVDHTQYGITMKMVNFGTDLYVGNNNDAVRKQMSDYLGSDNNYKNGNTESGLLNTALGEDGYPVTKANNSLSEWFADRPEVNHLFIKSTYNATGYYEYDSTQNFAHLDQTTNTFTVYKELAASATSGQFHDHGHFWPYNDIEAGKFATNKNLRDALGRVLPDSDPRKYEQLYAVQKSNTNYAPDYYMGIEISAAFTQTPNGLDDWGHDIIYEFTGDDDFWLFVDGELIIDLGGIHDALPGSVNYRTGEVTVNGTHTTLRDLFYDNYLNRGHTAEEAEAYVNELFEQNEAGQWIFKAYSAHTMKIYYLERGAGASNLQMRFNLASIKPGTAQLTKHLSGVDTTETILAEFPYQIVYRTKDSTGSVSEHYLTNAVKQDSDRLNDYVFYKDSTTPVTYQREYTLGGKTYNDVFILKPEETADINFPLETFPDGTEFVDYKIIECGVNTAVYAGVTINDNDVSGTEVTDDEGNPVGGRLDYATDYADTEKRSRVVYDNEVNPDALTSLTITKKLHDVTGQNEITEENDISVFNFRLYLATESGDIDSSPAAMHTYHVKDPSGDYCKWDVRSQRIVSLGDGKSVYAELSKEEQEEATFHTSLNGSISKIPVGYTIEVRDLLVGTKFKLVERPSEVPDGYSFKKYTYNESIYTEAAAGISDTISSSEGAHVEVDNAKGFGLRVNKIWADKDYMSDRDPVYFGIFYENAEGTRELVPGSLTMLPYGSSTVYWYYDQLPIAGVTDFWEYEIYEASLTNPTVDEDNKVTSYDALTILDGEEEGEAQVQLNGKQTGDTESSVFTYTVSYDRGELSANNNVRVDEVTNSRPGIILRKTDWDGTEPLAGAVFSLKDESGNTIGEFVSDEQGLITTAFLSNDRKYILTEKSTPTGYYGLSELTISTDSMGDVSVRGALADQDYYTLEPAHDTTLARLTIKNRPYTFTAVKLDGDSQTPMKGVTFALHRQRTVDGVTAIDVNPMSGYENLTTDAAGRISKLDSTLPAGTYELREKRTLSGYELLTGYIRFTITDTGAMVLGSHPEGVTLTANHDDAETSIRYQLSILNFRSVDVTLQKKDEAGQPLTGAKFSLCEQNENGIWVEVDGYKDIDMPASSSYLLQALGIGRYRLEETKAPGGYLILSKYVYFDISVNGSTNTIGVSLTDEAGTGTNANEAASIDGRTITVVNTPGAALPSTGGSGVKPFYLFGLLLAGLGASGFLLRRRHAL